MSTPYRGLRIGEGCYGVALELEDSAWWQPSGRVVPKPVRTLAATGYAGLALLPQVYIPAKVLGYVGDLFSREAGRGGNSSCLEYTRQAR